MCLFQLKKHVLKIPQDACFNGWLNICFAENVATVLAMGFREGHKKISILMSLKDQMIYCDSKH